jgi:hypothetical protein
MRIMSILKLLTSLVLFPILCICIRRPFSIQGGPLLVSLRLRGNRSSLVSLSVAINQAHSRLGKTRHLVHNSPFTCKTWNPRNVFLQVFPMRYPTQIPLPLSKAEADASLGFRKRLLKGTSP